MLPDGVLIQRWLRVVTSLLLVIGLFAVATPVFADEAAENVSEKERQKQTEEKIECEHCVPGPTSAELAVWWIPPWVGTSAVLGFLSRWRAGAVLPGTIALTKSVVLGRALVSTEGNNAFLAVPMIVGGAALAVYNVFAVAGNHTASRRMWTNFIGLSVPPLLGIGLEIQFGDFWTNFSDHEPIEESSVQRGNRRPGISITGRF